jgi:hypothetical protein
MQLSGTNGIIAAPAAGMALCFLQRVLKCRFIAWQVRQIVVGPPMRWPEPRSTTRTVLVWSQVDAASNDASARSGERLFCRVLSLFMRPQGFTI